MHNDTWQTQEAKAHFSAVLRAAQTKPQWITYRGEKAGVLISEEEYDKLHNKKQKKKKVTLGDFLRNSPLYKMGDAIDISRPRVRNKHRDINFDDGSYV